MYARQAVKWILWATLPIVCSAELATAQSGENMYHDFELEARFESRSFFDDGLYEGQSQHFPSLTLLPEYHLEWGQGRHAIRFKGLLQIDRDQARTHADINELYWSAYQDNWELSIGFKKVFWGKTESVHLVDMINQTDALAAFDGEAKLGQPMLHFSLVTSIGIFDAFAMPYFRTRAFPGIKSRLRPPLIFEESDESFESPMKRWHPDFAVRWSHIIGNMDIGVSYFRGTGREPILLPGPTMTDLQVMYAIDNQLGIDAQLTTGPWILKFEGIARRNSYQDAHALATGFEYTFGNLTGSGIDLGLLAEYLYDNRGRLTPRGLDNDLFVGSRIAFNDVQSTEILAGAIIDLSGSTRLLSLEASRRIGTNWKASLEIRGLVNVSQEEMLYQMRKDSFIKLTISRFF